MEKEELKIGDRVFSSYMNNSTGVISEIDEDTATMILDEPWDIERIIDHKTICYFDKVSSVTKIKDSKDRFHKL